MEDIKIANRRNYLLSKGFRPFNHFLYKVDLPTDGVSLVADINYNLWMEYWYKGKLDQSVGFGNYSEKELDALLKVLLK